MFICEFIDAAFPTEHVMQRQMGMAVDDKLGNSGRKR
jgi:hypothetical protein